FESLSAPRARTSPGRSRSRSKSTAAATSGPANEPRPASSAPATNRAPSARSNPKSRRPARRTRGLLEESDPARGPVGEEGNRDDPIGRDRSPEAAAVRVSTVVPHPEVVAGQN